MEDLLALWGDNKVQAALAVSHHNMDQFESIATKMQKQGHNRTVLECRSKTKLMRLEYKWVVALRAHLGLGGGISCPHFDQLDRILSGNRSIKAKRVAQSFKIIPWPQAAGPVATCPRNGHQTLDQGDRELAGQRTTGKAWWEWPCRRGQHAGRGEHGDGSWGQGVPMEGWPGGTRGLQCMDRNRKKKRHADGCLPHIPCGKGVPSQCSMHGLSRAVGAMGSGHGANANGGGLCCMGGVHATVPAPCSHSPPVPQEPHVAKTAWTRDPWHPWGGHECIPDELQPLVGGCPTHTRGRVQTPAAGAPAQSDHMPHLTQVTRT